MTTEPLANKGTRWTEEEDRKLSEAFCAGQGDVRQRIKGLADAFGRTAGAVEARLHRLDLVDYGDYTEVVRKSHPLDGFEEGEKPSRQGEPWTEEDVATLLAEHEFKRPIEETAAYLQRSPRSLVLKLVSAGVVVPKIKENPSPEPLKYPQPKESKEAKRRQKATGEPVSAPASVAYKISVTPEFQTAYAAIERGDNLLILGSAGTGKSTFLKWLRKKLHGTKRYAVLAPTGMAALQVGGQTIHSFFGFKPQLLLGAPLPKPRSTKLFENLDLLVIDEISMVRADVFDAMDAFLRRYGKYRSKPFGGVQIVLMGDLCQLPPIVRSEEHRLFSETYTHPFFFATSAWTLGNFYTVRFTQIFRQKEEGFISILNAVRDGRVTPAALTCLNERLHAEKPDNAVILAARNRTVDEINHTELEKLSGEPKTYAAKTSGDLVGREFSTPSELTLKVGARVMFTRNDKAGQWVNGSLGVVQALRDDYVEVLTDKGLFCVEREKWESTRYAFDEATQTPVATVAGTFTQFPLTLAWALTIHKAQGQTLEQCIVDLSDGGTFAEGQLYVALSRARSLESLYLTAPIQARHVKTHPAVMGFYEGL